MQSRGWGSLSLNGAEGSDVMAMPMDFQSQGWEPAGMPLRSREPPAAPWSSLSVTTLDFPFGSSWLTHTCPWVKTTSS